MRARLILLFRNRPCNLLPQKCVSSRATAEATWLRLVVSFSNPSEPPKILARNAYLSIETIPANLQGRAFYGTVAQGSRTKEQSLEECNRA